MRTSLQSAMSRGFTLVEVAVVLLVISVLIAMAAAITRGVTAAQKRSLTATRMAMVDAAILQFVTTQRRLPCPANGTLASSDNNAGIETNRTAGAGCTTDQANGVVPWRALALTELEATDGWDRRLTYRVFPGLAADGGMDMTWCDPAGTGGAPGPTTCSNLCVGTNMATCTRPDYFLQTKGLRVRNLGETLLMNPSPVAPETHSGAAYVMISHGESGGGGFLNGGTLAASTTTDGVKEALNYATQIYDPAITYHLYDDTLSEVGGANHFDDIVSRPSILGVISKAGLGPRTH
jgi:prepilin-type N-terminal cleavage/methylation domain-containing protein